MAHVVACCTCMQSNREHKQDGHIQTKSLSSYDAYVFSACSDDRSWTRQAVVSRLSDDPSALGRSSLESGHDAVHHDHESDELMDC